MSTTTLMEQRALQYLLVDGFSIFPVGKDKKPLIPWQEYQTRHATEEEVHAWFKKFPYANIGIATGKISGITVVDIDTYKENHVGLASFPKTLTVETGNKGYHLYYNYHPGLTISAEAYPDLPGVDIRSDGGYVVAPPSVTSYLKEGKRVGGEYSFIDTQSIKDFPSHLFKSEKRVTTSVVSKIGVKSGSRNTNLASFIGSILNATREELWATEAWNAVVMVNKANTPPLSDKEVETTFESIAKIARESRQTMILSPMQPESPAVIIKYDRNKAGTPYANMANAVLVLSTHPLYKGKIRFNAFRQEIELHGTTLEDEHINSIMHFIQTEAGLNTISLDTVYNAIQYCAYQNKYDEAQDWLTGLQWDGVERLSSWLSQATGVEDTKYHNAVGANWIMGSVKRIMYPGTQFDHMLLLIGGQGIGKTSFFRIIGGKWYKSYTGSVDNKDFHLALRGALILDLDEGASLNKADSIKLKSVVSETHDEFRAPYGKVMKKYPRRFVFSMSTNDAEPFKDVTGNRRYWTVDVKDKINFEWLINNRDQLFAEAYFKLQNKIELEPVPEEEALARQDAHLAEDSWTDDIVREVKRDNRYKKGNTEFFTTVSDIYRAVTKEENLLRLNRAIEMRITTIFKKELGLEKVRKNIDGDRFTVWQISAAKLKELQKKYDPTDIF